MGHKKTKKQMKARPGRPGNVPKTITHRALKCSAESADLINTMYRTVERNVNSDIITLDEVAEMAMVFPLLLLERYFCGKVTCSSYCGSIMDNWQRIHDCFGQSYLRTELFAEKVNKTATLNDGV